MKEWDTRAMAEVARNGGGNLEFNIEMVREFRLNKGVVTGNGLEHMPLLILTTVGARTLRPRMRPVGYVPHDGKYALVASLGGSSRNPNWHHNLMAHPYAIIEVGEDTFAVKSTLLEGEQRQALFDVICTRLPIMAEYQSLTCRPLPIHLLEVIGPEFGPDRPAGSSANP